MEPVTHPSRWELEQYASRQLPAAGLLTVDDHLAACAACRAAVTELVSGGRLSLDDGDAHLSYEQIEQFVEGRGAAEDRALVEQHLHDCEMCADEVQDLRELVGKHPRRSRRFRWWMPASAAIAAGLAIAAVLTHQPAAPPPPQPPEIRADVIHDGPLSVELGPPVRISGATLSAADGPALTTALSSGTIAAGPGVHQWNRAPEALLGDATAKPPAVLGPVAETSESDRPVFRWRPVKAAASYRVEVYDSAFNQAAASGKIQSTEWQPATPLPRGQAYSWVVSARLRSGEIRFPQPPDPEAKFDVLSAEAAAEMSRARQSSSLLLVAVVAGRYGLWREAREALDQLARLNPSSAVVAGLRRGVDAHITKTSAPR